ncbi:MAG: FlgD immunoglobulin-like domain containing protein [bacterium]
MLFKILNILGQRVRTLVNAEQQAGFKSVVWDASDDQGKQLPSGVYFYQMVTPNFKKTKKLLFLR